MLFGALSRLYDGIGDEFTPDLVEVHGVWTDLALITSTSVEYVLVGGVRILQVHYSLLFGRAY